jgi:hypothetical protein
MRARTVTSIRRVLLVIAGCLIAVGVYRREYESRVLWLARRPYARLELDRLLDKMRDRDCWELNGKRIEVEGFASGGTSPYELKRGDSSRWPPARKLQVRPMAGDPLPNGTEAVGVCGVLHVTSRSSFGRPALELVAERPVTYPDRPQTPVVSSIALLPYLSAPSLLLVGGRRVWKRRRLRQRLPGHCSQCGYDLRSTPGQCPECGALNGLSRSAAV